MEVELGTGRVPLLSIRGERKERNARQGVGGTVLVEGQVDALLIPPELGGEW